AMFFGTDFTPRPIDYETERLRERVEHYERQEEEAREARRQQRERLSPASASNRLYHGEARDFREAVRLHIDALLHEAMESERTAADWQRDLDKGNYDEDGGMCDRAFVEDNLKMCRD